MGLVQRRSPPNKSRGTASPRSLAASQAMYLSSWKWGCMSHQQRSFRLAVSQLVCESATVTAALDSAVGCQRLCSPAPAGLKFVHSCLQFVSSRSWRVRIGSPRARKSRVHWCTQSLLARTTARSMNVLQVTLPDHLPPFMIRCQRPNVCPEEAGTAVLTLDTISYRVCSVKQHIISTSATKIACLIIIITGAAVQDAQWSLQLPRCLECHGHVPARTRAAHGRPAHK